MIQPFRVGVNVSFLRFLEPPVRAALKYTKATLSSISFRLAYIQAHSATPFRCCGQQPAQRPHRFVGGVRQTAVLFSCGRQQQVRIPRRTRAPCLSYDTALSSQRPDHAEKLCSAGEGGVRCAFDSW